MESVQDIVIPRKYTDKLAPSIHARVFIPTKKSKPSKPSNNSWPAVVYFHGGGWVLGDITTETSYCSHVAELSECIVISVDYRLAPQDPFPACVDDAFEAVLYVSEIGPEKFGIDNTKICVAGSSAGGNLTAIVTHKFANAGFSLPPLCFQMMIVPVTDNTATPESNTLKSWKENQFAPQLPASKMLWYRELYLPNGGDDLNNPESSPLFYSDESFAKVSPAFIAAGECDVLRSDAEEYAKKLKKNGINTELVIYKGMPHTVMVMDGALQQGRDLVNDTTTAIRRAFYD